MQAFIVLSTLFSTILAAPVFAPAPTPGLARRDNSTAEALSAQLLTISPSADSCDGAKYPDECRTAPQAAQPILDSFDQYNITSVNEQAALISLMMYESGDFKYNWGHFVSGETVHTPGKGTRNMQSATFNEAYARSLFPAEEVDAAKASGAEDGVLELVSPDEYSFASAAWFITSQCTDAVRAGVQSGEQAGWETYLTDCIGTSVDQGRIDYWTKAKAALSA
ncbi:hypothetical protein BD626DRAFT_489245 [Schizophyllum amplum]|uniref:Lysozyme-like domain-containing protein n=1 Tax=Schizophyllum amplum TaxID=97359 RepID=A0A550CLE8_9AGAR|nr:hypothetical protein BD626DRAFT_489245 [Auriculariopsis ampla]